MDRTRRLCLSLPLLGLPLVGEARDAGALKVGERLALPDFPLLDGRAISAADLRGKVVVLEYWASWCPFCKKQLPYFDALYRARQAEGLVMVGLNIENDIAKARDAITSRNYGFPVAMTTPAIDRALKRPKGLPITYVIGRDGLLKKIEIGEMFEEDVAEIGNLLAAK